MPVEKYKIMRSGFWVPCRLSRIWICIQTSGLGISGWASTHRGESLPSAYEKRATANARKRLLWYCIHTDHTTYILVHFGQPYRRPKPNKKTTAAIAFRYLVGSVMPGATIPPPLRYEEHLLAPSPLPATPFPSRNLSKLSWPSSFIMYTSLILPYTSNVHHHASSSCGDSPWGSPVCTGSSSATAAAAAFVFLAAAYVGAGVLVHSGMLSGQWKGGAFHALTTSMATSLWMPSAGW